MLVQILIPCFYGSEISAISYELSEGFFHSVSRYEDLKFTSAMKLFMEKVKRLNKISIFGVYDVNLSTFTIICRSAYSLYALITSFDH